MKWISVKHTKPGDSRRILIWYNGDLMLGAFNHFYNKWETPRGNEISFQNDVTHWAEIEGPTS